MVSEAQEFQVAFSLIKGKKKKKKVKQQPYVNYPLRKKPF